MSGCGSLRDQFEGGALQSAKWNDATKFRIRRFNLLGIVDDDSRFEFAPMTSAKIPLRNRTRRIILLISQSSVGVTTSRVESRVGFHYLYIVQYDVLVSNQ